MEQDILDYVLGSCASYMESDTRDATDKAGFCRMHYKKMYDYGNTLGKRLDPEDPLQEADPGDEGAVRSLYAREKPPLWTG